MAICVKSIKIKNHKYYFFNDIINIKDFDSNLLKIDKKSYKNIGICNIGYITIKKTDDYENIYSVNPLNLTISSAAGHLKKLDERYLILDSTDKCEEVWSEIRSGQKLKHLMVERNCFMKKTMLELKLILTMICL